MILDQIDLIDSVIARQVRGIIDELKRSDAYAADRHISLMWGGGKDSTLALLMLAACCEQLQWQLSSASMLHPGMPKGALDNIAGVSRNIAVKHRFFLFSKQSYVEDESIGKKWIRLYRRLYTAVHGSPRFMCLACNLGSIVTEFSVLSTAATHFMATGNMPWELAHFESWLNDFRGSFGDLANMPSRTGNLQLDYFRAWHCVYSSLLLELFPEPTEYKTAIDEFLYAYPADDAPISNVKRLSLFELRYGTEIIPSQHHDVLRAFGWRLPDDIIGCSESDCAYPAAIAYLNIRRNGREQHLLDIGRAAARFHPLPEMVVRAKEQTINGRAESMGLQQLTDMGVLPQSLRETNVEQYPVAMRLLSQLFVIR
ncbi:MAG TPA: hypothetical protein VGN12_19315 [Pirellulales bacterium]|jgi:hypothetical protein